MELGHIVIPTIILPTVNHSLDEFRKTMVSVRRNDQRIDIGIKLNRQQTIIRRDHPAINSLM
jgi:hypothetical protein